MKASPHNARPLIKIKIILGVFLSFCAMLRGQEHEIVKITTENGLSHSTVFDMVQDDNGLLWFGTREGLNRYDSNEISTFYKEDTKGLPSNWISSLLQARDHLWVGTSKGLTKYTPSKNVFKCIPELLDVSINDLFLSKNFEIYISSSKGLYKLNQKNNLETLIPKGYFRETIEHKTNIFWVAQYGNILMINSQGEVIKNYELNGTSQRKTKPVNAMIFSLFKDSQNNIWVGTSKGLYQYNEDEDGFFKNNLISQIGGPETKVIRSIAEDSQGNLYFGGEAGLIIVDMDKKIKSHLGQAFQLPNRLSDKSVYSLFVDNKNIVWIGTYFGGVNYFKPKGNAFKHFMPSEFENSVNGKAISEIIETRNGNLWIGTEDGGISIYNKKTKHFEHLKHDPKNQFSLSSDNVHSLFEDDDGTIWAGTFLGGLNAINPITRKSTRYVKNINNPKSISNNYVYSIYRDSQKRLWIGTQNGLNLFDDQKKTFDNTQLPQLSNKFIYDILEDNQKNLWFCTRFNGVYKLDSSTRKLKHYSKDSPDGSGICSNEFVTSYKDSSGKLWFGTMNGGLVSHETSNDTFKCFGKAEGLPNNNVYGIIQNPQGGGLWLTTNKGLVLFNPKTLESKTFTTADGLEYNQFNFKSSYKDSNDWIYFGSVKGLTYFHPDTLQTIKRSSRLFFKDLRLFNEPVPVSETSLLQSSLNHTKHITLNHDQNALTLEFIGVDYISEGQNSYSYFLEGFDNDWNHVGDKKTATYTNLPHGEYVFHLKTNDASNELSDLTTRNLAITILPPFWKTNWAYALYFLVFSLITYASYSFVRFVQTKNLAVKLEKVENEKIKEITKNRLNFFTFISHEFKTPLTLINAAIDQYSNRKKVENTSPDEADELKSIQRSAKKLNHLVRQLMMFRKIETKHEKLNLVKGDVVRYLKDTFSVFYPLFISKGLASDFSSNLNSFYCHFDGQKLETILSNLLSNAFKNTESGGEIDLEIAITPPQNEEGNADISIRIKDTGHGFDEGKQEELFTPFFTNSSNDVEKNGTGIGLSLVKSLVEFLEGTLTFESEVGKGTNCIINLPLLMESPSDSAVEDVLGNQTMELPLDLVHQTEDVNTPFKTNLISANQSLLVAEDNQELRTFLSKHFSEHFNVITAKNGKEAWQKIEKSSPDIVVSDIKMPLIDGNELCHRIKTNEKYSHIPVLLLTAQSSEEKRLNALNAGANAFLPKPFNLNELDIMVRNLLNSAKNFESRFATLVKGKKVKGVPFNNKDREFKLHIIDLIEANIDNPNFTIEELANSLGISRSLLHLRMKKITNGSASDFIKSFKMERAKELIEKGYPISEVSYKIGFNDPNYFSRAFKKYMGMSPSSYVRKKRASLIEK